RRALSGGSPAARRGRARPHGGGVAGHRRGARACRPGRRRARCGGDPTCRRRAARNPVPDRRRVALARRIPRGRARRRQYRRRASTRDRGGARSMSVVAFIGRTERGPVDRAVPIPSFDEYCRIFGGHTPLGFVSYAVQHFFLHGGENAVVVRLTNGATPGSIDVPAGDGLLRLVARRPGSREHLRVSVDYEGVEHSSDRFNLVVQRVAGPGSQLVEDQELYPALSLDPADPRFVVDALRESELVRLVGPLPSCRPDATPPKFPGEPFRYVDMSTAGTDGDELTDYDIVGSKDEGTGLFALDRVARIDILCVPAPPQRDFGTTALIAAERYCRRGRALLVWDPPSAWPTSDSAVIGMRSIGFASTNAMTYFPRLRPRGRFGDFPPGMPACGALAGLFASGDKERGHPGGPVGALKASFSTLCDLGEREATRLLRFGVNPLMRIAGGAVVLDGNVCLAPE